MPDSPQDLVVLAARRLGVALRDATAQRVVAYLELLERWGGRVNLTSRADLPSVIERHLPDALIGATELSGEWVDVGSGAGLPALLLAILRPELRGTLVESNRRKCSFLRTAAHELKLGLEVLEARLESLSLTPRAHALSRATFSPAEWLLRATPLVNPGGTILLFAAREEALPIPPQELREVRRHPYALEDGTPRLLLVYQR